uniref:trypsin n=1 Tax=Ditylum brightwellii TaxID=49249 RepID=A0A6V2DT37_9STRA|mmetsp:Transcript_8936/g.11976  ORF Transcript_8936/g.11976 Transcript_8936/m.11976 type:complete len:344 (+) Transcript_8936:193-1224(+)
MSFKSETPLIAMRVFILLLVLLSALVGFSEGSNVRGDVVRKHENTLPEPSQPIPSVQTPSYAGVEISIHKKSKKNVRNRSKHGAQHFSTESLTADARVFNGLSASVNEFPFYALIMRPGNGTRAVGFCGSSHIEDEWILTAAHCDVQTDDYAWIKPLAPDRDGSLARIEECFKHPGYYFPNYDFQLCRLRQPSSIPTIRMADDTHNITGGTPLTAVGMGAENEGQFMTYNFKKAVLPYRTKEICESAYYHMFRQEVFRPESMLCAGGGTQDVCRGDSGGPLFHSSPTGDFILVGIVSFGPSCSPDSYRYPGVYADVRTARDWIDRVICNESSNGRTPSRLICS